ncbi:hypothetical protein WL65_13795 [Burkholderia ubonensis]|nr:hypothetical protein WJ36_02770 [Burkholderia ubonensis]KWD48056.1 hypothetical protein WL65_13795 [Burkholderia ubonensis]OJA26418.1 hypothetical protein BGX87_23055 [Burkholderia ubonensis]
MSPGGSVITSLRGAFRRVSIRSPSQPFVADDRAQIACDLGAALHDGRIDIWHLHSLTPLPVGHDVAGA